ncbi:MAG: transporter substrate-binding domain-containing protein [Alphaproteobacteria bacterium]|nr:transporter substrate-binding domain-containing protein [Alphaproteobacteria bacterium]
MRLISITLCVCLCLISVCGRADRTYIQTQRKEQIQRDGKVHLTGCGKPTEPLKVSTFSTNPPFGWTEIVPETGRYTSKGFGVDKIKEITKDLNIYTRAVGFQTDEEAFKAFQSGKIDILVGQYYNPKLRGDGHTYLTPSLFQNVISVVFMKGKEKEVRKFKELIGLKGVVRKDELFYSYIYPLLPKELQIEQVIDSKEAFSKLITGEADYLLASPYSAEAEARRFKINQDIVMTPVPLLGQELFVLYSKNSMCPEYRKSIAKKLKEKKQDTKALSRELINYIDVWGQRFRDDPPLTQELYPNAQEESPIPENNEISKATEEVK